MATGNTLVELLPRDFFAGVGGNPQAGEFALSGPGVLRGIGFHQGNTASAYAVVRMPGTFSASTGLTFKLIVAEDQTDTLGIGGNVVFGVNVGPLGNGSSYYVADTTNLGTQATVTQGVPTSTNAGKTMEISIPIVTANINGVAANIWTIVQIQRLGANASDTCKSRVQLLAVSILDT